MVNKSNVIRNSESSEMQFGEFKKKSTLVYLSFIALLNIQTNDFKKGEQASEIYHKYRTANKIRYIAN